MSDKSLPDVGVVDTMISFPTDPEQVYGVMRLPSATASRARTS